MDILWPALFMSAGAGRYIGENNLWELAVADGIALGDEPESIAALLAAREFPGCLTMANLGKVYRAFITRLQVCKRLSDIAFVVLTNSVITVAKRGQVTESFLEKMQQHLREEIPRISDIYRKKSKLPLTGLSLLT